MAENDEKLNESLFPEYLDSKTENAGGATTALQLILMTAGYNDGGLLLPDGIYGDSTRKAVASLQSDLGIDVDGKFGPNTRRVFCEEFKVDINKILANPFLNNAIGFT